MKLIMLAVLVLIVWFSCAGCAGMRITGTLTTPYGSISSDGKTVNLEARTGFAK